MVILCPIIILMIFFHPTSKKVNYYIPFNVYYERYLYRHATTELGKFMRFIQKCSYILSKYMVKLHFTPNEMSLFGFYLGCLANLFLLRSGVIRDSMDLSANLLKYVFMLLFTIFYFLHGLFDLLDGGVARLTDSSTIYGSFLDRILDMTSDIITWTCLTVYCNFVFINQSWAPFIPNIGLISLALVLFLDYFLLLRKNFLQKSPKLFAALPERWVALVCCGYLVILGLHLKMAGIITGGLQFYDWVFLFYLVGIAIVAGINIVIFFWSIRSVIKFA